MIYADCNICLQEFEDSELFCVEVSKTIAECDTHEKCPEYYCRPCFDENVEA